MAPTVDGGRKVHFKAGGGASNRRGLVQGSSGGHVLSVTSSDNPEPSLSSPHLQASLVSPKFSHAASPNSSHAAPRVLQTPPEAEDAAVFSLPPPPRPPGAKQRGLFNVVIRLRGSGD
ncbi:hypothetical protein J1605_012891 [Eschrichtius robustus]|uniref:Uncharacterized protein n=1 Tax=Eschrichtius robustus TaxID=9764 RepID=A0AB34GKN4_ESCRO|nr:hypothetical protein J1605_012891 [Eschrichtius robustus]